MFKIGDKVKLLPIAYKTYMGSRNYYTYTVTDITSEVFSGSNRICSLLSLDGKCVDTVFDYKLVLDKEYYRRIKLEKICSKLEI